MNAADRAQQIAWMLEDLQKEAISENNASYVKAWRVATEISKLFQTVTQVRVQHVK